MSLNIVKDKWYSEGLRFKCTGCGECCTGAPGHVWVTPEEIQTIADHLKMSLYAFGEKYVRIVNDRYSLIEDPVNYDCIFLKNKKCTIYSVRPVQCRTFPWWISTLNSREDWDEAASMCEGINHPEAPLTTFELIEELREKK